MTTLIAWAGVDQRSVASLYLAADSRVTWPDGSTWDVARKLFYARTQPHVLGFCGDALFPSQVLGQVVDLIDRGLLFTAECAPADCFARVAEKVTDSLGQYPDSAGATVSILHGIRVGESMKSRFHLFEATFRQRHPPETRAIEMPLRSEVVAVLGSGALQFRESFDRWSRSDAGGTSRAVFSALADAIREGRDPQTGGAPQLVGLYRKDPARPIGVVWDNRRWLLGTEVKEDEGSLNNIKWHNSLFEITDPVALARHEEAQPQPRPRGVDGPALS